MVSEKEKLDHYLEVGVAIIIHTDPSVKLSPRIPSVIRGWQVGSYILVDNPRGGNGKCALTEKEVCGVRYLLNGQACAFDTPVLGMEKDTAGNFIRLKWPATIEHVDFRKTERITVSVPCTVTRNENETLTGNLQDVSLGGCCVVLNEALTPKTEITLSFVFPDGEVLENAVATVCNSRANSDQYYHGLAFKEDETNGLVALASYISRVSERRRSDRGELEPGKQVLIIENDHDAAHKCLDELKAASQECVSAQNVVDAMYHLRVALPKAILIKIAMPELNGLEIGRLVRSVIDAEHLKIYLYGTLDDQGASKAAQLGLEHHPDLDTLLKTVVPTL